MVDVAATYYRDEDGYPVAELSVGVGRRTAGYLTLTRMSADDLSRDCLRGLNRLRSDEGDEDLGILAVSNVRVEPWARGQGIGVALYEEAARIARKRFRSAIVSHECVGGQTSSDADRVWNSSRFRYAVSVRGNVAVAHVPSQENPSRSRKAMKRRNPAPKSARVNIAAHLPGVPPLWGTMKTVGGLRVVEVSPTLYLTPDLEVEAAKFSRAQGDEFTGWVVRCDRYSENSDPIPTKAEALRAMVNWPRGRR